jgi:hypothetical protein
MKVSNMLNQNGRAIPNQFIIRCEDSGWTYFQSYRATIAKKGDCGAIYLDKHYWDYSHTTSKYRNQFLGMKRPQIERAIKNGSIVMTDLNKGAE